MRVVHAPEVISMDEHPVTAVRSKRHASIPVGLDLVARGEADAFVTAGNTGAAMAAAVLRLKRLEGIDRPALALPFPTPQGVCLLLDVGANSDARAHNLVQFAFMGVIYTEGVLGIRDPRVALLSIGEEESKGNLLVQEAHRRLKEAPFRFIGNIEGKDLPAGVADVVVTDGFVGNVLIKFAEGASSAIVQAIRTELRTSWWTSLLALGLAPAFSRVRRRMDYAEFGGAPLLGINGVCIIAHGRSNPRAIRNAIRVAAESVHGSVVERIRAGVAEVAESLPPDGRAGGALPVDD
jgi:glycerol-3-phosphate acyltransferase PlsX